jgi:hypothetical protein
MLQGADSNCRCITPSSCLKYLSREVKNNIARECHSTTCQQSVVDRFASDSRPARAAAQEAAISHGKALKREHSSAAAKVVMCSRLCRDPCTPLTTSAVQQLLGGQPRVSQIMCASWPVRPALIRHQQPWPDIHLLSSLSGTQSCSKGALCMRRAVVPMRCQASGAVN